MARIELIDIAHSYALSPTEEQRSERTPWALHPMTLTWNDGGAYALLGPSGCGKTTLLNIISGLITPTCGKVLFDGQDVTHRDPRARNIAQVFQFPVIYDTMTVFDNLAFPLRNRRWRKSDIRSRVHEVAELLELTGDLPRQARGLTADAKQKISLGRGLVRPDVAAVLFDEPLTVIDPHLKWLLRRKLKQIHQQLKLSLLYVTHDQVEALTFADQVAVMTQGQVVQTGAPQQLFETPAHTFVGDFIGSPGMNFLPCELTDDAALVGEHRFAIDAAIVSRARAQGAPYKLGMRPEFIDCSNTPQPQSQHIAIRSIQSHGAHTMISAQLGQYALWIKAREDIRLSADSAWMRVTPEHVLLYANERLVKHEAH